MYVWRVKIPEIKRILTVYAENTCQCDLFVTTWLKKQNKPQLKYIRGNMCYYIKPSVPADIIEQEKRHLGL